MCLRLYLEGDGWGKLRVHVHNCSWQKWSLIMMICSFGHSSKGYIIATVQLRYNFTLPCEQFTHTLEQYTWTSIELLVVCGFLPARNSCKIIRWSSGVVSDMVTHVNFVIDHRNVLRLVLGLVSRSQNLFHRALIH